ncbi:hypothetical protein [Pseudoxanthomonas sp.]|jgi:hypothetical protein|uniref:hypothetical protein n=1 Tax=Pseudoxanthomonas sp. TaxID=1871049 RepID=UPI002FDFEC60
MPRLSVIALLIAASPIANVQAGERTHYLYLVNRAHDRVVSVATTPVGGSAWRELLHGDTITGGGDAVTVQLASDQCVHDVEVEFVNGRRAVYPAIDLCRHHGLRIQPLRAQATKAMVAVQQDAARAARHTGE